MAQRYSRRRMGDRRDGRRLRTLGPVVQLTPFFMRKPSDAVSSFTDSIEISNAEQWLRLRRADGREDMTLMHLYVAAYVRTVALCPGMNRFVAGRYLYARNAIDVVFSSGHSSSSDAGTMAVKVSFLPTDTVFDVCRKINAQWDDIKADEDAARVERFAETLIKTPRFVLRMGTSILRAMDYLGWLGTDWTDRSPFHGSLVISDEGAFGLPPITRGLNSLGSLPVSLSFGRKREVYELTSSATAEPRRYVDYTATVDARIADHSYIGTAFKYFRYFLQNPDKLLEPPTRLMDDEF